MKYAFHFIIFSLIIHGCKNSDSLINYELPTLKSEIKIPTSYKAVNNDDIKRIITKTVDLGFKNELLAFYNSRPRTKLLIDTLNPYRFIMISEISEYVPIDSNSFYDTIEHERNRSSSSPDVEDSTYYVGSKIDTIPNFKFIVSKYQRKLKDKQRIAYSFVISSKHKTIGIGFYSPMDERKEVMKYINTLSQK